MDYKYIHQLLNKFWEGNTSLEEEHILKSFFSQSDIPNDLIEYKPFFVYTQQNKEQDILDSEFDNKMLALVGEDIKVKAKKITLTKRIMPLFKAVAMLAIVLTLGNAMMMSFDDNKQGINNNSAAHPTIKKGNSVAFSDSAMIDTVKQSNADIQNLVIPID